jgi:hypothetical protein
VPYIIVHLAEREFELYTFFLKPLISLFAYWRV